MIVRNLNSVVTLSDRDTISYEKSLKDITGSSTLNNKLFVQKRGEDRELNDNSLDIFILKYYIPAPISVVERVRI